jgi:hypothetical protein
MVGRQWLGSLNKWDGPEPLMIYDNDKNQLSTKSFE